MKPQISQGQMSSLSPSFKSQIPKSPYKDQSDNTPGPGTYGIPQLDYQKTAKYHVRRQKTSDIKKEHQWIFSSTRTKSFSGGKNREIGPGSYDVPQPKTNHQIWSKCTRFKNEKVCPFQPGPGFYDPQKETYEMMTKFGAQSVFKSKTPKTLFKDTLNSHQYNPNQGKLYSPIEQNSQLQEKTPKKAQRSSFFASKVPRFMTESSDFSQIGPGSYQLSNQFKRPDFPKLIRYSHHQKKSPQKPKERVYSEVGPGSYNIKKYDLSHDLDWKGKSFSRETRFNFRRKKRLPTSEIPGPGQYIKHHFHSLSGKQSPINLSLKRGKGHPLKNMKEFVPKEEVNELLGGSHGPGQYELDNFNIDFRLRKKMEHKQKLKIMEISMAGFNSKVPRFR